MEERQPHAGETTAKAEIQLRQLLDTVADGFCVLDREYRFTYVNRRAEEILGRPREELLGRDARLEYLLDPDDLRLVAQAMEGALAQVEKIDRRTGRWFASTIAPVSDGVSVMFRDVTASKQTEGELRRLAAIVESSDDAIVGKDLEGRITNWNAGAERLFGYTAEETVGKPISMLMPEDHKRDMAEILDRIRRGERVDHFETVRIAKDGHRVVVSLSVSPIRDASGRVVGAAKIARDITERREAERRVREAQRQLQIALAAARMGTWTWDIVRGRLSFSPAFEEILGVSGGGLDETYQGFLVRIHPEDRDGVEVTLRRAIEEDSPIEAEFRVPRPDGKIRWVSIRGQVFRGDEGIAERAIGIGRDTTEDREAQAERERLYREAQEAVKARDAFLSVAGHEFRTPLGALSLTVHNLARMLGPVSDKAQKALEAAQRQLDRLVRLTEDLLEVGRINAGRLSLDPEPTDLGEVAEEVADRLHETAKRAGCSIGIRADGPVVGMWDRSRIDQVVTNLLTNALNFGRGRPVEVSVAAKDGTALLTVRDHGIGVSPENQSRIFERFERAVSERSYRGIGLGLWITRQIVDAHGGSIGVESEPGKGATFRVQLPGVGRERA